MNKKIVCERCGSDRLKEQVQGQINDATSPHNGKWLYTCIMCGKDALLEECIK